MDTLEVTPAYGVDYKNQKEVKAAWNAGADFKIETFGPDMGRYINKQDADNTGAHVVIRYSKLRNVLYI